MIGYPLTHMEARCVVARAETTKQSPQRGNCFASLAMTGR